MSEKEVRELISKEVAKIVAQNICDEDLLSRCGNNDAELVVMSKMILNSIYISTEISVQIVLGVLNEIGLVNFADVNFSKEIKPKLTLL